MKVTAVTGDITKVASDAIIINLFEGTKQPGGATAAVDKALGGAVAKLIKSGEIKGKRKAHTGTRRGASGAGTAAPGATPDGTRPK